VAAVLHESEQSVEVPLEVIEKDAANPAWLAAVRQIEVLVAPLLEARVIDRRPVTLADLLPGAMEVDDVFTARVVRCQVGAAAEPLLGPAAKKAKIRVHGRHQRTTRVKHQ